MSLNGYSYVEGNPVNRRDPSGECPQNPHPFDVFGWRCRFLAEGLAARIGVPAENYMWMDYGQLESLTALGSLANVSAAANQTLDNASIIPMLFLQNPQLTLKALELFGCQNQGTPLGFASMLITQGSRRYWPILAGTSLAVAGLILWGATQTQQQTQLSSIWNSWLHPLDTNPQTTPTPRTDPYVPPGSQPIPTPTPRQCGSTLYRIQGGTGNRRSWEILEMTSSRDIVVRTDIMEREGIGRLWVVFDNPDRALNYLLSNRPGGYIISFGIDSSFVTQVRNSAPDESEKANYVDQFGLQAWNNTPIIGDSTLSYLGEADDGNRIYTSFGLPKSWIPGMIASVCPGTGSILSDN